MYKGDFARMGYLFRHCNGEYIDKFEEVNGITVSDYLEIMVALWIYMENNPKNIYVDYKFYLKTTGFPEETIEIFLGLISRTKNELKEELEAQDKVIAHPLLKFGEHTPLFRYPMLKVKEDSYVLYGKTLLKRALCLNLFEFTKGHSGEDGIQDFASNFENYVGELLRTSGAEFIREDEISGKYGGKQTDFLIHEDSLSIMVEVKSIRLSDIARANPTNKTIPNALEDNVIKAIFQGHELSNRLYEEDETRKFVLIVVAYDDLFLGPPSDAWDYYLKDSVEAKFESGEYEKGKLDPEDIFMVSAREFEKICTHRKNLGGFSSIIESALKDNAEAQTKKMTLSMSCPEGNVEEGLCVIDQNHWDLWENIIKRVVVV
ncbi:hypothetical protein [uncultured Pseudodesulfovibrio sp.]|uniref:hypothetical protein n=1 Tax=uncultured Pseudodesulfovibrio sp. TaxID=2035858 RepID=UPI0029C91C9E|nr:hypothetical protein [uncultured Pseudodesulfovibrio sp.]